MLEQELRSLKLFPKIFIWSCGLASPVIIWYMGKDGMSVEQIAGTLLLLWVGVGVMIGLNWIKIRSLKIYLEALKARQMHIALAKGRLYYGIKRGGIFNADKLTVYDEAAIQNDIIAYQNMIFPESMEIRKTESTSNNSITNIEENLNPPKSSAQSKNPLEELKQAKELLDSGALTKEEYEKVKQQIIDYPNSKKETVKKTNSFRDNQNVASNKKKILDAYVIIEHNTNPDIFWNRPL